MKPHSAGHLERWASSGRIAQRGHKTNYRLLRHSFLLLCLSLGFLIPIQAGEFSADKHTPPKISDLLIRQQELMQEIKGEIGDPTSSDTTYCRVLPLGEKPCGGPAGYVVFSSQVSNVQRMHELTNELTEVDKTLNRALQLGSDCSIERPPVAIIVDGRCRVNPR